MNNHKRSSAAIALLLILTPVSVLAQSPSYLGTTGVLRVPSATLPALGQFNYQFNTASDLPREYPKTNNHVISIGFADTIELGGRLTDWYETRTRRDNGTLTGVRDLSGNLKWQLPLPPSRTRVAIGILDFAGEAIKLRSNYVVATTTVRQNTELSLGFAGGDSTRALDGIFAGARVGLSPNVDALLDYANQSPGFGIDYHKNIERISIAAQLSMDRTDNGSWNRAAGVSISVPLRQRKRQRLNARSKQAPVRTQRDLSKLAAHLAEEGFTHIHITTGKDGDTIEFRNPLYNHTDMDALVKVLSIAYPLTGNTPAITAQLNEAGHTIASISTTIPVLENYLQGTISAQEFGESVTIRGPGEHHHAVTANNDPEDPAITQVQSRRLVDIRLQPDLRTAVGSEWGVFDYSAALRADLKIPLPNEFSLLSSYSIPIANSDLYDDNNAFAGSRHKAQLNHAVLQRFWSANQQLPMLFSAGYQNIQQNDYLVIKQEAARFINRGSGIIHGSLGFLSSQEDDLDDELLATIGYTHHWQQTGFGLSIETGQYFAEEQGTKIDLFRFFGNSKVTTFINYVDTNDIVGGLQFGIPLTPTKDKIIGERAILRGSQFWQYETRTTIKDPDFPGTNRVRPYMLFDPVLSHTLIKDYLNNGRYTLNSLTEN